MHTFVKHVGFYRSIIFLNALQVKLLNELCLIQSDFIFKFIYLWDFCSLGERWDECTVSEVLHSEGRKSNLTERDDVLYLCAGT